MVIQARESDLVIATFGRGFYVLDDITPLRQMKAEATQQAAALYPVKDALMYVERHPLGGPHKGFQGDSYFAAENPPIPVTAIDLTGLGECTITIGGQGEIVSIAKAGAPAVAMSPADSAVRN